MNLRNICMAAPLALATAFGAFAVSTPAHAERTYVARDGEIVVPAPYYVQKRSSGLSRDGGETTKVSRVISYRGLDLRNARDVAVLDQRVHFAAVDVCAKLDTMIPASFNDTDNRDCYYDAMKDARKQVRAAVWRANYYR
jgi:UrcA family protein